MSRKITFSHHQGVPAAFIREKTTNQLWVVLRAHAFDVTVGREYNVCLAPSWDARVKVFAGEVARVCYASPVEWQEQSRLNNVQGIITNESWEQNDVVLSEAKEKLSALATQMDSLELFPDMQVLEG